jgi:hypothetical protein
LAPAPSYCHCPLWLVTLDTALKELLLLLLPLLLRV